MKGLRDILRRSKQGHHIFLIGLETKLKGNEKVKTERKSKSQWNKYFFKWVVILIIHFYKSWSESWPPSTPHPSKRPPFTFSLFSGCLWLINSPWSPLTPIAYLTAIHMDSQGQQEIPETWSLLAVPGTVVHSGKSPGGIQPDWQPLQRREKSAGDLVACGLLAPPAPASPEGRQLHVLRAQRLLPGS